MIPTTMFLVCAIAQTTDAAPDRATIDEYDRRARAIEEEGVRRRLEIARGRRAEGAHAWARMQYAIVLAASPENEEAKDALGADGGKGIPAANKSWDEKELEAKAKAYYKALGGLARHLAREHRKVADWCTEKGLKDLAREHHLESHAYDPTDEATAKALGYSTSPILRVPGSPETIELFRAYREDAGKLPAGEIKGPDEAWGPESVRKKVRVALGKHVGVESTWMNRPEDQAGNVDTSGWLEDLCRVGDHSFEMAHQILDAEPASNEARYWFAYVDDYTYQAIIEWKHEGQDPDSYKYILRAQSVRDDFQAYSPDRGFHEQVPTHELAHLPAQFVLFRRFWNRSLGGKAGIVEGFGILCEFMGTDSNATWCTGGPSTGSDGKRRNYRQIAADASRLLEDRPLLRLYETKWGSIHQSSGASKAASVWEWLLARDRADAVSFMKEIASDDADVAEAIKKHFGWSPELMDEHWRRWAIAVDEADRAAEAAEKNDRNRRER